MPVNLMPLRRAAMGLLFSGAFSYTSVALAHGDMEDAAADFHEHLDDYRVEVEALAGTVDDLVARRAAAELPVLAEHWEEVEVHEAIEMHVPRFYPAIWQGIGALHSASDDGDAWVAAGERFKAALWQGYGALRLAASQVEVEGGAMAAEPDATGDEAVAAIISELRGAVDAYAAGDTAGAEELIYSAYMERFEFLEGDLIAQDPELVSRLEQDFNATLPLKMQEGAAEAVVRKTLERMVADLNRAARLLSAAEAERSEVF